MKILGSKEIRTLVENQSDHCISINLPVHRLGAPQDNIRFKNLLGKAEKLLVDQGMRSVEAGKLLGPEYELLENTEYWKNLGADGLAVFCSEDLREKYLLPKKFSESVTVARRFRVKPLLPLVTGNGRYFILALNKNDTRLFAGSRFSIAEIGLPEGAPNSLAEALKYDDPQR